MMNTIHQTINNADAIASGIAACRGDEVADDRQGHSNRHRRADVPFEDRVEQMLEAWVHVLTVPAE